MSAGSNPCRRLAPCTSYWQCAHNAQNGANTTPNCFQELPHVGPCCHRLTTSHHQRRKTAPKNISPEDQMIFNIHNPNQDHRDRAACAFLLTA
jgi:hypothetical protein